MNVTEIRLSRNGIALVVILMFCLLLGGYFIGTDLYHYNDLDSAMTVLVLYSIMGIFGALFLLDKRYGLLGLMALSAFLLIAQLLYIVVFFAQTTIGPSWHDPSANWFITLLDILFSVLVLVFSFKVYRET
ncbi:MAG: hypothetical protein ACTSSD_06100 [Candidatus Thorarchaeota archaeon]